MFRIGPANATAAPQRALLNGAEQGWGGGGLACGAPASTVFFKAQNILAF